MVAPLTFTSTSTGAIRSCEGIYPMAQLTVSDVVRHLGTNGNTAATLFDVMSRIYDLLGLSQKEHVGNLPSQASITSSFSDTGFRINYKSWTGMTWGEVEERVDAQEQVINISESLAAAFDHALKILNTGGKPEALPVYYNFCLVFTLLHAFAGHALSKQLFGERIVTPAGLGPLGIDGFGESGWEVERKIFGGDISSEWLRGEVGTMGSLRALVICMPDGKTYRLPPSYMESFIQAICSQDLTSALPSFSPSDNLLVSPLLTSDSPLQRERLTSFHNHSPTGTPRNSPPRNPQGLGITERHIRGPDRTILGGREGLIE